MDLELQNKIVKGEVDVNNRELFMGVLFKALLNNLNSQMKLRDKTINHFIINTGDDIMWLENKGQDNSKEPYQVSNEDYVYNTTIYKFKLNNSRIELLAKGTVNGNVNDQFSMDEYDGNLRIATTSVVVLEPEKTEELVGW